MAADIPSRQHRAHLAHLLTEAVISHLPIVPANKVQIFFDPPAAGRPAIDARIIGPAPAGLAGALRKAIGEPSARVVVHSYEPDHTARGGVLREWPPAAEAGAGA
ncbi:MAG: hypothetical protein GXY03_11380 [Solirubrobacterales bacterium]|nr:hypothetical protein [Solirubrobacterales bacterium]